MLELLLGQIPEAIYFSLFMIYAKNLKEKRIIFTVFMIAEYILLTRFLVYNIWFQIIYTFMVFIILKMLYKEKAQITDIFLFTFSTIILGVFSVPLLFLNIIIKNIYISCVISKILLFISFIFYKDKLNKYYIKVCKLWNRNDEEKRKIKSLTLRNICMVTFNVIFVLVNIVLLFVKEIGGV